MAALKTSHKKKPPAMTKFLSICSYSSTTQRPVQSIFAQLNIYVSLDWDHLKNWKDINKRVVLAEGQDTLQPHSSLVTYASEIH